MPIRKTQEEFISDAIKVHGVKLYYISFEKNIPETYIDKIYTDADDLITEIKKHKKND